MAKSHHNTTRESGSTLKKFNKVAKTQDEKIFDFFQKNVGKEFSPCQVHNILSTRSPLTSVRRSITNLTDQDKLVKTGNKITGIYGRPALTWKLKVKEDPKQMSLI